MASTYDHWDHERKRYVCGQCYSSGEEDAEIARLRAELDAAKAEVNDTTGCFTGFTPGPWSVRDGDTVVGPLGNVIAECCGYSVQATDSVQRKQGGREANARLLAAAPDLYASLREARATLKELRSDLAAARAALAKEREACDAWRSIFAIIPSDGCSDAIPLAEFRGPCNKEHGSLGAACTSHDARRAAESGE